MGDVAILEGRACGSCTLCCKLLRIDDIEKPVATWCAKCTPGKGCGIYDARPAECRDFYCAWLTAKDIGPEWRPEKSKMVLVVEADGRRIALHVDPARPQAWRQEPYYSQLKTWAAHAPEASRQVVVYIKDRAIVLLPGKEVDLGVMARGDQIVVSPSVTAAGGKDWRAFRVDAKDVPPEQQENLARWQMPAER